MKQDPKLEIRQATRDDLPGIVRLLADDALGATRGRLEDPLPGAYLDAFDDIHGHPGHEVFVAVDGGEVAGCLQLSFIPGLTRLGMTRAQIEGVRIDKNRRGKGFGEALMKFAIDRARDRGCGLVQLTTDNARPDAHRFYERFGFKASHVGLKLDL